MGYKETMQQFWTRHAKSFVKTYVTVFLSLYLSASVAGVKEGAELALWNLAVIVPALQWSFIAVLRNFYKMLMEE